MTAATTAATEITARTVLSALIGATLTIEAIAQKLTNDGTPSDKAKRAVAEALAVLLQERRVFSFDAVGSTYYECADSLDGALTARPHSETLLEFRDRVVAVPRPNFDEAELTPEAAAFVKRALADLEAVRWNIEQACCTERVVELRRIRAERERTKP